MSDPLYTSIIGACAVVASATMGYLATTRQRLKKEQAENEMDLQRAALDFTGFLSEWSGVQEELEVLMRDSEVDRFLILRAWNGHLTPRWTTAIYQVRRGKQSPVQYIHFELDGDYVERLKHIDANGFMYLDVDSLPESAIKQIYSAEGVTASAWYHLESLGFQGGKSRAVTYCSFATHDESKLTEDTLTRCRILAGRLKGVALSLTNASDTINK